MFRNILIVDDDYASTYLARLVVLDLEVCSQVLIFQRALEALAYFRTHCMNGKAAKVDCPDLILLDMHMPEMDGKEFIEELNSYKKAHFFRTAIILLTIADPQREQAKLQAYSIIGCISKPLTQEKFVNLLNEGIRFL